MEIVASCRKRFRHDLFSHQPVALALRRDPRRAGYRAIDARSQPRAPLRHARAPDRQQRDRRFQVCNAWRALRGLPRLRHHRGVGEIQRCRGGRRAGGRRGDNDLSAFPGHGREIRRRHSRRRHRLSQSCHCRRLAGDGSRRDGSKPDRTAGARCDLCGAVDFRPGRADRKSGDGRVAASARRS